MPGNHWSLYRSYYTQPFYAIRLLEIITAISTNIVNPIEKVENTSSFVLCGVSILTSTSISVDRLLALKLGLRYRHTVTLRRVSVAVILFWLRYQPPFRTVRARIAVALVVFIKTPINHIFFKSLIIPDYGFELTKTIYLNVFRNWNALWKSARLYKSSSTPNGNKRKKTINTAFASQHVSLKNRVSDFWQVRLFLFY